MKKYKYLLIDLDNTILDFDLAQDKALNELFLKNGINKDRLQAVKDYYLPLNHQLWLDLEQGKISKKQLINTRFEILFKHFGLVLDGEKLALEFEMILGKYGDLIIGARDLLIKLKAKGFKLYALTNGIFNIQKNRLKNADIEQYFDDVFISQEFNYAKPHPNFFKLATEKIKDFNKKQALMIGDSLTADIQGAINFEIDSLWYNPKKLNSDLPITYNVANYQELLNILIKE